MKYPATALFYVCMGGVAMSVLLCAFFSAFPGANAGRFLLDAALFAVGAVANFLMLPKK